jgi:drug/metabolite transporter (DMT)-like permease
VLKDWWKAGFRFKLLFQKERIEIIRIPSSFIARKAIFLSSTVSYLGTLLLYIAYNIGGQVTISNMLPQIRIPIALIYGIIVLGERTSLLKKVVCTVLILVGIAFLKL